MYFIHCGQNFKLRTLILELGVDIRVMFVILVCSVDLRYNAHSADFLVKMPNTWMHDGWMDV